jgi:hypothetical protein
MLALNSSDVASHHVKAGNGIIQDHIDSNVVLFAYMTRRVQNNENTLVAMQNNSKKQIRKE